MLDSSPTLLSDRYSPSEPGLQHRRLGGRLLCHEALAASRIGGQSGPGVVLGRLERSLKHNLKHRLSHAR
jgi:hypothetical protein